MKKISHASKPEPLVDFMQHFYANRSPLQSPTTQFFYAKSLCKTMFLTVVKWGKLIVFRDKIG